MRQMDRRGFLLHGSLMGFTAAALLPVRPLCGGAVNDNGNPESTAVDLLTPPTLKAIDKGLVFLASRQQDDGSFGSGGYSRNVGVCGLAGMAFMSAGSTPGRGPYGKNIDRAIDFVLSQADESGFITVPGSPSHGPMYGHGFATLFLAEMLRHDAPQRHPRKALARRAADRQYAEQRRRLAISAASATRPTSR